MLGYIKKEPIISLAYICLGIGLIVLAVFIYNICGTYVISRDLTPEDMAQTGQIGDFMGGVIGSIWALAGVLLYFSALRLQQQEMKSQREEMAANQKLLDQQLFETTFFNLLKVHNTVKENLQANFYYAELSGSHLEQKSYEVKGGEFFNAAVNEFSNVYWFVLTHDYTQTNISSINDEIGVFFSSYYDEETGEFKGQSEYDSLKEWASNQYKGMIYSVNERSFKDVHNSGDERKTCAYAYWLFFHRYEYCLGHYCRLFYNIIKYLDKYKQNLQSQLDESSDNYDSELKQVNEKVHHYFSFVQANLSTSELFMLFYNMLLFPNAEKLYSTYNIFENMYIENLIKKDHLNFFENIKIKSVDDFRKRIWYK